MTGRVGPRGFGVLLLAGLIGLALAIVVTNVRSRAGRSRTG